MSAGEAAVLELLLHAVPFFHMLIVIFATQTQKCPTLKESLCLIIFCTLFFLFLILSGSGEVVQGLNRRGNSSRLRTCRADLTNKVRRQGKRVSMAAVRCHNHPLRPPSWTKTAEGALAASAASPSEM